MKSPGLQGPCWTPTSEEAQGPRSPLGRPASLHAAAPPFRANCGRPQPGSLRGPTHDAVPLRGAEVGVGGVAAQEPGRARRSISVAEAAGGEGGGGRGHDPLPPRRGCSQGMDRATPSLLGRWAAPLPHRPPTPGDWKPGSCPPRQTAHLRGVSTLNVPGAAKLWLGGEPHAGGSWKQVGCRGPREQNFMCETT